jgi:type 1 glutamine amidotransferase
MGIATTLGPLAAASVEGVSRGLGAKSGSRAGDPQVLALIGDRFHNSDYIRTSLDRLFDELGLSVNYTTNYDHISASLLRRYQLFVCLRDGMIWPNGYLGPDAYTDYEGFLEEGYNFGKPTVKETPKRWITDEQGEAIRNFVLAGNGFYALHNSSDISLSSKSYRDVMGGAYGGHPPLRPFKVQVVNKRHPVTQGVNDFMVNDEQHYVTYDKDPKHIILRAENIDGLGYTDLSGHRGTESISGWAYDYGKGRVVFTAVGHTNPAMWQPEYFKIQKNAVRWLLKMT